MDGAHQLWTYLWEQFSASCKTQTRYIDSTHPHPLEIAPRLRSLDVVGGPYLPDSMQMYNRDWTTAAQQRFQIDLSERDDESRKGIATVKCVELEALKSRFGASGPYRNDNQVNLMHLVRVRSERGPFVQRVPPELLDRELTRHSPFWDRHDERRFYYS